METYTAHKHEFKTEVKQLLDLVIHSLYSHPEIFLRELISNAADAIDRLRFEAVTNQNLLGEDTEFKIKIIPDLKKKTLTIRDNGVGMNAEELAENLGTIAKSGTKVFIEQLKAQKKKGSDLDLIGQFGVGFYASFMVADTVTVLSKKAGETKAYQWFSNGENGFSVEEAEKETRGTDVVLHLKKEAENYLEEYELRNIVRKYSDFVAHAIVMDIERSEKPKDKDGKEIKDAQEEKKVVEEILNSRKAIWAKAKSEVTAEEYQEFYKHISHDYSEPLKIIHYTAEGTMEFKALLYIPSKAPFDMYMRESMKGVNLYIKKVLITDDCKKLIPEYLRFIRGVVDASDLPLNVSREMIQEDVRLEKIKKNIVKKVLGTLKEMLEKEKDLYNKFFKEFGAVLKEGLHYDFEHKEIVTDLLLFETTRSEAGAYRSLKQYVDAMPKFQKEIYYCMGEDKTTLLTSPHLEVFKNRGYEVLLLTDPIDEWVIPMLTDYKGKKLKAIDKGDIDLDDTKDEKEKEALKKENEGKFKELLETIKTQLGETIEAVKLSNRLTDSPSCLVAGEHAFSKQMEMMFKQMGQDVPAQKKVLEVNPKHPVIELLNSLCKENKASPELKDYIKCLYDQALVAEGSKVKDPQGFVRIINDLLVKVYKK